ncbi:glycosyl hydrolase family 61-domain-containing protein [Cubamyces lactineus]|nr:glycosyl hydrolase family 61-domain-containing protein [Cubamyces lactineus]
MAHGRPILQDTIKRLGGAIYIAPQAHNRSTLTRAGLYHHHSPSSAHPPFVHSIANQSALLSVCTMHCSIAFLSSIFTLLTSVAAHGWVANVTIDGKTYQGNPPDDTSTQSPIRTISSSSPVTDTTDPSLACGQDAQPAALVVPAKPGSALAFAWTSADGHWFHNVGPITIYMALCDNGDCTTFDATKGKWFKTDQAGLTNTSNLNAVPTWVQASLDNGTPYTTRIPEDLKAGQYLIRAEIIALQNAVDIGGAEFYPSCTQLNIGGDGEGAPNATVSFPGAYSPNDPGIHVDVYNPGFTYAFPGPPMATVVPEGSGSGTGTGNAMSTSADASQSADSQTAISAPTSPSSSFTRNSSSGMAAQCTCGNAASTYTQSAAGDRDAQASATSTGSANSDSTAGAATGTSSVAGDGNTSTACPGASPAPSGSGAGQ